MHAALNFCLYIAWQHASHKFWIRTIWNFQISKVKKIYTFWYPQRLFTNLYTILQAVNYTNWTSLFCSRGFFQKIYFTIQNFKVKNQMIYTMYTYVYFLHVHPISNAYIYIHIHVYVVHICTYTYTHIYRFLKYWKLQNMQNGFANL